MSTSNPLEGGVGEQPMEQPQDPSVVVKAPVDNSTTTTAVAKEDPATMAASVVATTAPAVASVQPGGIVLLDRGNSLHQKILCESYVFNVGVGNSRRRDLFPGNRSFWDWVYQEGFFQRWVKASTGNNNQETGRDILDQVYSSWKAAGGEFYRYENSKSSKQQSSPLKDGEWRGETLSPLPKDAVLGELHKRFTTTRSNMKQPRKKQAKSIWYSRLDPQEQQQLIIDKQLQQQQQQQQHPYQQAATTPQSFPYVKTTVASTTVAAIATPMAASLNHSAATTSFRPPMAPLPGLDPTDMSIQVTGMAGIGQALGVGSNRYKTTGTAATKVTSPLVDNATKLQHLERAVRDKDARIAELEQALARYKQQEEEEQHQHQEV
mmetsp:Transcript_1896/g.5198  ORF Transcript_1896/g.5198 Transcript_1896/m.5198 type:complete len:378 (+) Transcript_1896:93-1226(+)|eukprot:CAMPEP_0168734770 /NCGR_PEP_ID=MMETSP0724-20121128/8987_1 /TAXON_ID=265536 /ORGANISM="Amphiprora sp., Strain CCMP467" /LENGTH=377 /DNA_ID=CAMNT_0008781889 /DNA_START=9 /DNA_END=1142 /DNA_ORIENTATION=+